MPTLTHDVLNQSLPFEDVNLFETDLALREALDREGARWAVDRARDTGAVAGSAEAAEHGRGALGGRAMPEKRGGSDGRANPTRAGPAGDGWWELPGQKWFCSYPPCDV